jgi:hypothetical protein
MASKNRFAAIILSPFLTEVEEEEEEEIELSPSTRNRVVVVGVLKHFHISSR